MHIMQVILILYISLHVQCTCKYIVLLYWTNEWQELKEEITLLQERNVKMADNILVHASVNVS